MYKLILSLFTVLFFASSYGQGLETFDSLPAPSSNYQSFSWTGENEITWSASDARTDQTINGRAIAYRNGSLISGDIPNGIGTLAFKYKYLFTQGPTGMLVVKINNIAVDSIEVLKTQTTPAVAVFNNINIGGNFFMEIVQSHDSARIALDSLTWTAYAGGTVCTEPAAQPTGLNFTTTSSSIAGSFTPPTPAADLYLVIRSLSPTLTAMPQDGSLYGTGTEIGGGTVIGLSNNTSFTNTELASNTTFYYFIFSANNSECINGPNYNITAPLTGNSTTTTPVCDTPTIAEHLELSSTANSVSGVFEPASYASKYLILFTTDTINALPVNGTFYTPGTNFAGATVLSFDTSLHFSVGNLASNTLYHVFVFSANTDCTGEPVYNPLFIYSNVTTLNVETGIPEGYYSSVIGLTCQPLKTGLKNIMAADANQLTYSPGLWNLFPESDAHNSDNGTQVIVWDMYSDNPTGPNPYEYSFATDRCGTYTSEGNCFNREHSTPQSWFGGASPMVSDAHHIFPVDGKVNEIRGNNPYGVVSNATTTTQNGSKLGTGNNFGYTGTVFEPINEYKGDFARAALYMAVRYEDQIIAQNWSGNSNANEAMLSAADQPDAAKRRLYIYDDWYLKTLIAWHNQDPVSQKEIDRNNVIFYHAVDTGNGNTVAQHTRNPFIDHPEFVSAIFECNNTTPTDVLDTLISFTGTMANANTANLNWNISQGNMLVRFVLERGQSRTTLDSLANIVKSGLTYNYTDNSVPAGDSIFYRLKMIYNNSTIIRYSNILALKIPTSSTDVRDSLLNFTAVLQSNTAAITNWTISQGNMISRFVLERGTLRTNIDSLAAVAKTSALAYSQNDNSIPTGIDSIFYRLKVVYGDGSIAYSRIVALAIPNNTTVYPDINGIAPNPASDYLNVYWSSTNLTYNTHLAMYDGLGKKMYAASVANNQRRFRIPLNKFTPGIYYLNVLNNNKIVNTYKVLVRH